MRTAVLSTSSVYGSDSTQTAARISAVTNDTVLIAPLQAKQLQSRTPPGRGQDSRRKRCALPLALVPAPGPSYDDRDRDAPTPVRCAPRCGACCVYPRVGAQRLDDAAAQLRLR